MNKVSHTPLYSAVQRLMSRLETRMISKLILIRN
jgi:hypothetical protein